MPRFARTIDLATGEETLVPFTPDEEAAADAGAAEELARRSEATVERNGEALDDRQMKTAKGEVAALAKGGDYEAAITKLMELL